MSFVHTYSVIYKQTCRVIIHPHASLRFTAPYGILVPYQFNHRTMNTTHTSYILYFAGAFAAACVVAIMFGAPLAAHAHKTGSPHDHASSTINLTCMQTAVQERETAVASAFDAFATDMKAAYADRKAALNTAWGMTDAKERNTAIKAAWKEFRKDRVEARKDLGTAKKNAWREFRTTAKAECKEKVPKDEGESNDSDA
jgi:hypothetical protein